MSVRTAVLVMTLAAATASAQSDTVKLDPMEAKELAKSLQGKAPGKPVECVWAFPGTNLTAVGDHVLLYRESKNLIYRNDLMGACHGLRLGNTLVLDLHGDQYCRGDIAHVVDLTTGAWLGSCALGSFVPYTSGNGR